MVRAEDLAVSDRDIEESVPRVAEVAWRTPLVPAGRDEDGRTYLKLECLQRTGSFKIRGAWNRMSRSTAAERRRGFVTVSAGNHGQAVAWCARRLKALCTVWVPDNAVARKVAAIEELGARVKRASVEEIMESMVDDRWARDAQVYVAPFGDPAVIAGQGTIGLEIFDQLPEVRSVVVPVGGGGLATGVSIALRARPHRIRLVGVQAERRAPLALAWRSGKTERVPAEPTIADGIGATVAFDFMLPGLRRALDEVVTVSEDDLRQAVASLARDAHVVAEPAGAAALAATRRYAKLLPTPVVCLISGGNVDPALLSQLLGHPRPARAVP